VSGLNNEDFKVPIIVRVVTVVLVVLLTSIATFFISMNTVGYEFNFNPFDPSSYLVMLPGTAISLIASLLVPSGNLKGALIQAGVWAAPVLLLQEGFKGLADPAAYIIPCAMIAGALLGFALSRKVTKSRRDIVVLVIIIAVLAAGPALILAYQHIRLQPIAWEEIVDRRPDLTTSEILGNREENGNIIISVKGVLLTEKDEVIYSQVDIVVDANTNVYKRISAGYVKASKDELLKAGNLVIWFSSLSDGGSGKYTGTAEKLVID
jgi:hypothetical protein